MKKIPSWGHIRLTLKEGEAAYEITDRDEKGSGRRSDLVLYLVYR